MSKNDMGKFVLDNQLRADTFPATVLGLCQLRLMNDNRWPWLILVPQRAEIEEIHQLTPLDQTLLTFEICETAKILQRMTGCDKINIGALGNMVPQLHIHIIARTRTDPAWPGPVWGVGMAQPYDKKSASTLIAAFEREL